VQQRKNTAVRAGSAEGGDGGQPGADAVPDRLESPGLNIVVGCLSIWAWPWLVASLFTWTSKLRPLFRNHPLLEVVVYAGTGLALVRLSLMSTPAEAGAASTHAIRLLLQGMGSKKWLAEMLSRALFAFISGASRGMLLFVGTNLCANALPDSWSAPVPSFLPALSCHTGSGRRHLLHARDVELMVFKWSQRVLFAFLTSLLGYCLLRFKAVPKTPVPESEGLRRGGRDRGGLPSLARLVYARQNPRDKRVRSLVHHLALPDRILDFLLIFGLVVLPWTYLLGLRPQTVLAVGGVGGLAVGLAAQNLVGNLISGVLISLNRPFGEGDEIEAGGAAIRGVVEGIGFTVTRINRLDGVRTHVPNAQLLNGVVVNRTIKDFRWIRETVPVVAADLQGLPSAVQRIQALLDSSSDLLQAPETERLEARRGGKLKLYPPICAFTGYGEFGAKLYIQAYTRGSLSNPAFLKVRSDLLLEVNRCLADCGLSAGFGCFTQVPRVPEIRAQPAPIADPPQP